MTRPAYYNENDKYAAAWLRALISRGLIANGDVDERSILEVKPDDLRGYAQCHFFAGIGGWSHALRLAGWPDDRPVWTGSCPCQPFSAAGKQRGSNDERHLWPAFFDLIRECRPASIFGEQVAGAAGFAWLDHVCADLEGAGYAAAAADLCAAGAGAPHIRQRLYWVANADQGRSGRHAGAVHGAQASSEWRVRSVADRAQLGGAAGDLADTAPRGQRINGGASGEAGHAAQCDPTFGLADPTEPRPQGRDEPRQRADAQRPSVERTSALDAWSDIAWLECTDGKVRPTQRGLLPLAAGLPQGLVRGGDRRMAPDANESAEARVMRLRGYGNSIVPQLAAAFVLASGSGL